MGKELLIIDDHTMVRNGLKFFLEQNSSWTVIGEAGSGREALALYESLPEQPDAAIVDISLPDMDGIELVRHLAEKKGRTAFIMYSMHVTAEYIASAIKAGALAYISKSSPSEDVLAALDSVSAGNPYLDSCALKIHLSQYAWNGKDLPVAEQSRDPQREPLTFQEGRVFALAARNMTNSEIASELCLKVKTVENYMSIIYQKLYLKNRYDLLDYARKTGVLS